MTRIKFCGLTCEADIKTVNLLKPDHIGFVFFKKSRRYISFERVAGLREHLDPAISPVGVFVDENPDTVAEYLNSGVIDLAQLHGREDTDYILNLRGLTDRPLIKAFLIKNETDVSEAERSSADHILLDAGMGDGNTFEWSLLEKIQRPYFLAGGLDCDNIGSAIDRLHPYGVDVSSGIETGGVKDPDKMRVFSETVRSRG